MSNSILFRTPIFSKKDLNFSIPIFCATLTEPIFPDLIKISSTVKLGGILLSYSLIGLPAHIRFFGKFLNSVVGSISFSCIPAAIVKVLKTEPSSYTPLVALLINFTSLIYSILFKLKSGKETIEIILPLSTFIKIPALPLLLKIP